MKFQMIRAKSVVAMILAGLVLGGCAVTDPSDPLADAIRGSDHGVKPDPTKVASMMRVANSTARSGDISTEASFYRRAHNMDVYNPLPLIALGNALSGLGAHEQAAEAYRKAIALKPNDPDALHGLSNAMTALDQPVATIDQFEAVLKSKKAVRTRTYNGIGVAHDMMGDHDSAQAFYRTGLKSSPGNLSLRNNLRLSLALARKSSEAIEVLRRVAADTRAGNRHRLNLALAYGLSGNNAAAREVARIDLDEPAVRRNLAYYRTLRAQGLYGTTVRRR